MEKFPDVKAYVEDRKILTVEIRSKFSDRALIWLKEKSNIYLEQYKHNPPVEHTAIMVGDNLRRDLTYLIEEGELLFNKELEEWYFKEEED